jgi:hypothetical protein
MRARLLTLVILAGIAGACSTPPPPTSPPPPAAPVVAFDGRYVGNIRITRSHNNWCETPSTIALSVQNNTFTWTLSRPNLPREELYNPTFNVSIGPDGAFDVEGGNGELTSLKGQIAGKHMAGEIDGKYCGYVFSADRS